MHFISGINLYSFLFKITLSTQTDTLGTGQIFDLFSRQEMLFTFYICVSFHSFGLFASFGVPGGPGGGGGEYQF